MHQVRLSGPVRKQSPEKTKQTNLSFPDHYTTLTDHVEQQVALKRTRASRAMISHIYVPRDPRALRSFPSISLFPEPGGFSTDLAVKTYAEAENIPNTDVHLKNTSRMWYTNQHTSEQNREHILSQDSPCLSEQSQNPIQ